MRINPKIAANPDRAEGDKKTHGLIVDYLGVFDDVDKSLEFDEDDFAKVVSGIQELAKELPGAVQKCLAYFHGCDRTLSGYEGLILSVNQNPDTPKSRSHPRLGSLLSSAGDRTMPALIPTGKGCF
jgi:hypothetical protein